MRARMIFKFGLTVIVLVAVYMYYAIQKQQADSGESIADEGTKVGDKATADIEAGDERIEDAENDEKIRLWVLAM